MAHMPKSMVSQVGLIYPKSNLETTSAWRVAFLKTGNKPGNIANVRYDNQYYNNACKLNRLPGVLKKRNRQVFAGIHNPGIKLANMSTRDSLEK